MGKETELTHEQIEGIKQHEAERMAIIERVLAKHKERKQSEIDARKLKKRGTKKGLTD